MRIECKILRVSVCLFALLCLSSVGYASQPSDDVHFCLPLDAEYLRTRDSIYAATKHALDLNIGEPRTVRMIYFLPDDRPFRQEVIDSMKVTIRQIQTFYAEQMQAHGYGNKTFRFETDAQSEPMVYRVDGQHPDSYYFTYTFGKTLFEVEQAFDIRRNIYLIVIDNGAKVIGGNWAGFAFSHEKNGGVALLPGEFRWTNAAHELGHAFGLQHDFSNGAYIMSYGPGEDQLSACSAKYLAVQPYFNLNVEAEELSPPTIQRISSSGYTPDATSVPIRLKVSDSEGLHQVILYVETVLPHPATGSLEVKAFQVLDGESDTVVEFDYDGVIPSDGFTRLGNPLVHLISVEVVDNDGNVKRESFGLWEILSQHIATFEGHTGDVHSVAFSPDGRGVASTSQNGIKLWDIIKRENIAAFEGHTGDVHSVAFSPDGTILASGAWRELKLWDFATRRNIATFEAHTSDVSSVSFSPDGSTLASGSSDRTIKLWDVATGTNVATFEGHTGDVHSVAFSPDGTILASGSWDNTVRLWDVATGENIATLEGAIRGVYSVSFSPDGTILASGSQDGTLKLWDVATLTDIVTWQADTVYSVTFSPDGTILASGEWREFKLWDVATRKNIATLKGHTNRVFSLAFSPDGTTLVSGSEDRTVKLWDVSQYVTPVVNIPDANLRSVIRDALGKSRFAPITTTDMVGLSALDASNRNIRELDGLEFATNLTELNLVDNPLSAPAINTHIPALQERGIEVLFDKIPSSDFDGNGTVGLADFLLFVAQFGFSEDDEGYDAQFDLDGDGMIGIGDFLIFANAFGKVISSN
ncbi:MAG: hypothetical protein OXL96_03610 [Candidatus Poribacteria bacterium]|nr:hypothetical protein [Candidatus Poribacteria bacterium]